MVASQHYATEIHVFLEDIRSLVNPLNFQRKHFLNYGMLIVFEDFIEKSSKREREKNLFASKPLPCPPKHFFYFRFLW